MATVTYTGAAKKVARVRTHEVSGYDAATTYFLGVNGKTVSSLAAGDATQAMASLVSQWNDSTEPEFAEQTAAQVSSSVSCTITSDTPGVYTNSTITKSGGTGTVHSATTTENNGPSQYDSGDNWSSGAIPSNSDTVIIEGSYQLLYGDLSAVTAARLIIRDFDGQLGLPPINVDGQYPEYRSMDFDMKSTLIDVLQNVDSGLIRINNGAAQTLCNVYSTGSPSSERLSGALTLKGSHVSNVFNLFDGSAALATEGGDVCKLATFTQTGGDLELGLGCTLVAGTIDGGTTRIYASMSGALVINAGEVTIIDSPTITGTTKVYQEGTLIPNGNITFTGAVSLFGGTMDCAHDSRAITTTNGITMYPGATLEDPYNRTGNPVITMAGGADTSGPQKVNLRTGPNKVHTLS